MTRVRAFCRADKSVGIRNHLFVLPTVVCANQVAINVARRQPGIKYIEHQHGCAQIGEDLAQTSRVFTRLAVHPNVFATAFVGLGCEAILSRDLFRTTSENHTKPMNLFVIQELGNTESTGDSVEHWLTEQRQARDGHERIEVDAAEVRVGLMVDEPSFTGLAVWQGLINALVNAGFQVIVPEGLPMPPSLAAKLSIGHVSYGQPATHPFTVMQGGTNQLEIATGISASGAHVILHLASKPHAFGSPLVPVSRIATDDAVYATFSDDFDGCFTRDGDHGGAVESGVATVMEHLIAVVEGQETVSEEIGLDDFALYRIGPTV